MTKDELEFLVDELMKELQEKEEEIEALNQMIDDDYVDSSVHKEVLEVAKTLEEENKDLKETLDSIYGEARDILRRY